MQFLALQVVCGIFYTQEFILAGEVVELTARLPCAFVFTGSDLSVRPNAEPARCAYAGGEDLEVFTILGNTHDGAVVGEDFIESTTAA